LEIKKVFGPPGSGKTTFLLNVVEKELADVHPSQIGYFAFTRKAATEAKERAIAKFPHLNGDIDFPWFRTLHSLAYHCLGVGTKDMMKPSDYLEFAKEAGIEVSVRSTDNEEMPFNADHPILNEINIARIKGLDLRTHYNRSNMDIEWYHFEYVERAYRHYKEAHALMDFTDLLERIVEQPNRLPSLDVLIIDEAQDLSRLQWMLVEELVVRSKRTYIAGDDDQAVYNWAGADVNSFLDFTGEVIILEQSWRVPSKVHALADRVVNRIRTRQPKIWHPRDFEGDVQFYNRFDLVNITQGSWLVLAATNYLLNQMHGWIKSQGLLFERHGQRSIADSVVQAVIGWERLRKGQSINYPMLKNVYKYLGTSGVKRGFKNLATADPEDMFTLEKLREHHGLQAEGIWHEALEKIGEEKRDYMIAMLRRGTKITGQAPIKLSTIHGAKGGEADNVLLLLDLSPKFMKEYEKNSDDVNRLLYVGITRAKKALHVVLPKDNRQGFKL